MATNLVINDNNNNTLIEIPISEISTRNFMPEFNRIVIVKTDGSQIKLEFIDEIEYNNAVLGLDWLFVDVNNRNLPDANAILPPSASFSINGNIVGGATINSIFDINVLNSTNSQIGSFDGTNYNIADSIININGNFFTNVPAEDNININIINSQNTQIGNIPNIQSTYTINDSEINLTNGILTIPAEVTGNLLVEDQTGNLLDTTKINNNTIQVTLPNRVIGYVRPTNFQKITYTQYDEAWHYINGTDTYNPGNNVEYAVLDPLDFNKLLTKNIWGNNYRFTGANGEYFDDVAGTWKLLDGTPVTRDIALTLYDSVYGNTRQYVVDHYTGIGWDTKRYAQASFNSYATDAVNSTLFGFNDWKIPSYSEGLSIMNREYYYPLYYHHLNETQEFFDIQLKLGTCTVVPNGLGSSVYMISSKFDSFTSIGFSQIGFVSTYCRYHFT